MPVVVGVRADFAAQILRHPALAEAFDRTPLVVTPPTLDELQRAITVPAEEANLVLEDGLVETMLADMTGPRSVERGNVGVLPSLSHTLYRIWSGGDGRHLSLSDYHDVGGVHGSVEQSAENAYHEVPAEQTDLLRELMLRLVRLDPDLPMLLGTVDGSELAVAEIALLEPFARHQLVAIGDAVRLTHETVPAAWPGCWRGSTRNAAPHRRIPRNAAIRRHPSRLSVDQQVSCGGPVLALVAPVTTIGRGRRVTGRGA